MRIPPISRPFQGTSGHVSSIPPTNQVAKKTMMSAMITVMAPTQ
jgi:hypothetical protein